MSSSQAVVIDQDGERGVIHGYEPESDQYRVEHDGREFVVPADLLTSLGQSYFSLPGRFMNLARAGDGNTETLIVPVIEESLAVSKRPVERGGVRVHVAVNEREVLVDEPLVEDQVTVERIGINQPIDKALKPRVEGDTTIIPVMKEVLMVRKQLVLVEEVRLTRKQVEVRRPQQVVLRSEEARVEEVNPERTDAQEVSSIAEHGDR